MPDRSGYLTLDAPAVNPAFAKVFYQPKAKQSSADHQLLYKHTTPAVDRFEAMEEEAKEEFRSWLSAYVSLYAFLTQITPWQDADLEKLYSFGRFLLSRLPHSGSGAAPGLEGEVQMRYFRIQKTSEGDLVLGGDGDTSVSSVTAVGTGKAEEEQLLKALEGTTLHPGAGEVR